MNLWQENPPRGKAWVIAVSMGYGHQRTAYPLREMSPDGKVLNANDYEGIPSKDKEIWSSTSYLYGLISRFKRVPISGPVVFYSYDRLQKILSLYPKRDLSRPTSSLKEIFKFIAGGWGKDMIDRTKKKKLPFVTTFFMTAFMAEAFALSGRYFLHHPRCRHSTRLGFARSRKDPHQILHFDEPGL